MENTEKTTKVSNNLNYPNVYLYFRNVECSRVDKVQFRIRFGGSCSYSSFTAPGFPQRRVESVARHNLKVEM